MQYVKKHAVYEKGSHEPALEGDGEDRLGIRVSEHEISMGREGIQHWTQTRLVQRNITTGGSKLVISGSNQKGTLPFVIDVRRAYSHVKARRKSPDRASGRRPKKTSGLLRKSLHGTRDAGQNWECELGSLLEEVGLRRRQASTCLYTEEAR